MGLFTRLFAFSRKPKRTYVLPAISPAATNLALPHTIDVVGESFNSDGLQKVLGGESLQRCVATLLPEPGNRSDRKAVAVFVGQNRIGYLSRSDARSMRTTIDQTIDRFQHCAVKAQILEGGEFSSAVLEPDLLPALSVHRIADALIRADYTPRVGDLPGVTMRKEGDRFKVFYSGARSYEREESVPEMAKALRNAGYKARVAREQDYPYVSVTGLK